MVVCLESSVILLSVTWLFRTFQYPMNIFHRLLKVFAYLVWSCMRMGVFPYMIYYTDIVSVKYTMIPLIILNTYWFYLLTRIAFFKSVKDGNI